MFISTFRLNKSDMALVGNWDGGAGLGVGGQAGAGAGGRAVGWRRGARPGLLALAVGPGQVGGRGSLGWPGLKSECWQLLCRQLFSNVVSQPCLGSVVFRQDGADSAGAGQAGLGAGAGQAEVDPGQGDADQQEDKQQVGVVSGGQHHRLHTQHHWTAHTHNRGILCFRIFRYHKPKKI